MKYEEVEGDLITLALEGKFDVIGHGCNCFCRQKRGIAPQMVKAFGTDQFPLEQTETGHEDDGVWLTEPTNYCGDINKLGQIDAQGKYIWLKHPYGGPRAMNHKSVGQPDVLDLTVVNMYTQYHWSSAEHPKPFDYVAFELCLKKLAHMFRGRHIGLPMIGAGLAGGDWVQIKLAIQTLLIPYCDVTIVKLPH